MASTDNSPSPAAVLFARGVIARLAIWPVLRLAVDESWAGSASASKRIWMASVLVDQFTEPEDTSAPAPDVEYIEEMLLQIMEDEFNTVLEDDSAEGVARDIVKLWVNVNSGNTTENDEVIKWELQAEKFRGRKVQAHHEPNDDNEWEDDGSDSDGSGGGDDDVPMLVDRADDPVPSQRPEPIVDEDGFTLVQGKGKGKGKSRR